MGRNSTYTGWWSKLLICRARGSVQLLANLLHITTRTLGRWASGEIAVPEKTHRIRLRKVAGEELLNWEGCPSYLRLPQNQKRTRKI